MALVEQSTPEDHEVSSASSRRAWILWGFKSSRQTSRPFSHEGQRRPRSAHLEISRNLFRRPAFCQQLQDFTFALGQKVGRTLGTLHEPLPIVRRNQQSLEGLLSDLLLIASFLFLGTKLSSLAIAVFWPVVPVSGINSHHPCVIARLFYLPSK